MGKLKMKKLNRKGFTLIELLAVIVILAILILMAMPAVLKVMENARQDAFATEVKTYLKAAEQKYVITSSSTDGPVTCVSRTGDETNGYKSKQANSTDAKSGDSAEKLDIDEKTGYKYKIEIIEGGDNTVTYKYTITNGSYYASFTDTSGQKITEDVNVAKYDSQSAPTACS